MEPMDTAPPAGAVAAAPTSVAPNMIGDFFGTGGTFYSYDWMVSSSSCCLFPGPGGVVGTTKIAENSSPMPQDRFFLNYSYFDSTPLYPGDVGVSRFTPGFEKTFCGGNASFEMRFPMASTLDSTILMDDGFTVPPPVPDTSSYEFGNLAMTPKVLLLKDCCCAISAGMTITLPTADDINAVEPNGFVVGRIENEAVHLMPFVGFVYSPNPCWFAQGYLQYDFATAGNPASVDLGFGDGLEHVGYLNDTAFQYLDLGIGRWLYRSCSTMRCERLRSVALVAEVHWNKSLQEGDHIEQYFVWDPTQLEYQIGNTATNVDVWDATVGLHVRLCNTTISAAYIVPLTEGRDKPFDGEFRLIINRWFGRSSDAYR
jgi:hypothetical protein